MRGSFSRMTLTFLFALLTILLGAATAMAHLLVVDIRTNWLPGQEFIATRARIDSHGLTETKAVFTTTPAEAGFRIAEFRDLATGTYRVDIDLLRSDETVLDTSAFIVDVDGTTAALQPISREGDPQPACEEELPKLQIELGDVKASLLSTQTELTETHHLLDIANLELAFFQDDADSDGILTVLDQCPGTPAGLAVDAVGCSVDQFCHNIGVSHPSENRVCRMADWGADEAESPDPGDCTYSAGVCSAAF
ncbi:MAG TPA: hypothetical protein VJR29_05125 [bacterium]|nr:hypothetical protein [bacterium]